MINYDDFWFCFLLGFFFFFFWPKGNKSLVSRKRQFLELRSSGYLKEDTDTGYTEERVSRNRGELLPGSSMGLAQVLHKADIRKKVINHD